MTENFNHDELQAPQWLNDEFFTHVLHSCEKDETIKLKSFHISPASLQGDHFASVMYRARVEYESALKTGVQSLPLILKTMPELDGLKKDMLEESYIMETEIGMYTEIIPKFEKILRSIGDNTILGARCLYHSLSPKKLIIFEDLVPLGYTVLRDRPPTIEEMKIAYTKLAKIHAISYKLNKENPKDFEKYCHSIWDVPNFATNDFVTGGITKFVELLERQPTLEKYIPYFEAMKPNLIKKCIASSREYQLQPQADAYYVLCHGDFHYKNMMFKAGEDVMLLDYQISHYGTIVNDIIYSIFMLMDVEQRKHHKDELIYFYFSQFLETLQRIGYDGELPKLIEFRKMLLRHKHCELFLLTTFLPIWYGFRKGDSNPEEIMTNSDHRTTLYDNKEYIAELEELLPMYLYAGYLDD